MGVKKRSGCDNQSQAAGAAEGGVRAALQSRQYAICSWAADDSREALALGKVRISGEILLG